jgi:ribosomal protection tetracycline resistance protein
MKSLNIGILAHVDAGKTSLTEQLLYSSGQIATLGSVNKGTSITDSLELERQRGITIKSAVASFYIDDVLINLVDTPGHSDFVGEIERSLSILDGVILVISTLDGVQPQTKILAAILKEMNIPVIYFLNKIDLNGALESEVVDDIKHHLCQNVVALNSVKNIGSKNVTTEEVENLESIAVPKVLEGLLNPMIFGSAINGEGVGCLKRALIKCFPVVERDYGGSTSGVIFKMDILENQKISYLFLSRGAFKVKDRLKFGAVAGLQKIQKIEKFVDGNFVECTKLIAGEIGRIHGFNDVKIGSCIGNTKQISARFSPPILKMKIEAEDKAQNIALKKAIEKISFSDPLVSFNFDEFSKELTLNLYGEVQQQVIEATLLDNFGIVSKLSPASVVFTERPTQASSWVEYKADVGKNAASFDGHSNPFLATVGLKVTPTETKDLQFKVLRQARGKMPHAFYGAIEEAVFESLKVGVYGWPVTHCRVELFEVGYWPRQSSSHGVFDKSISSSGRDFRFLTPLVLMHALAGSKTKIYQPMNYFKVICGEDSFDIVVELLTSKFGIIENITLKGNNKVLEGGIPTANIFSLQKELAGKAILETNLRDYGPMFGKRIKNKQDEVSPLDRHEYLVQKLKRS